MKLRSLFVFGAGVAAGLAIARKMTEDDPAVMRGPVRSVPAGNAATRALAGGTRRLADVAGVKSLDAIRRARGAIRSRLPEDDDLAWG